MQTTADDIGGPGRDPQYGFGLVDAAKAAGTPPNDPTTVTITNPADGSTFESGTTILFEGTASDTEDGDLTEGLLWTSDIDEQIGIGGSFSATLSDGNHTITAEVTDSGGKTGNDSIGLTVGVHPGEITVTGIEPNTIQVGTIVNVTISGSGFVNGADVTFENGSGPAPTASKVIVSSTTTITAMVTAKSGGPPRERVWDVRITNTDSSSGVKIHCFTVIK